MAIRRTLRFLRDPIGFSFSTLLRGLLQPSPEDLGELGEHAVNEGLSSYLDKNVYRLIEDVTLPVGDGTTQIDHLVVSRYGVFVIETKGMIGWIFGHPDHLRWTQVIYGDRHRFQNPIRQNYRHVKAVRDLLYLSRIQVIGVVAFAGDCEFKTPMPPAVVRGVSELVDFIRSRRAIVIDEDDLPRLIEDIQAARLAPGRRTDTAHVRNVRRQMAERSRDPGACPLCGGAMVGRTNRSTGERFLGCTRYPQCRGTRPVG